jgi:hypothetical protein
MTGQSGKGLVRGFVRINSLIFRRDKNAHYRPGLCTPRAAAA